MIESPHHIEQIVPSSVTHAEMFISRLWMHPLVDDDLLDFREVALSIAEENMSEHGVLPDQYALIPCGSFLWAVDPESDYDFHVIDFRSQKELPSNPKDDPLWNAEIAQIDHNISFISVAQTRNRAFFQKRPVPALLLTPDEFIVGNRQRLQEIRLAIMGDIAARGEVKEYWDESDSTMNIYFDRYFKNWPERQEKRKDRFNDRVAKRSMQTSNPIVWKEALLRALENFTLPSFATYKEALEITNGALKLNPRYQAVGIQPVSSP